jgi:hypothetical protein
MRRIVIATVVFLAISSLTALAGSSSAFAASPWWHLTIGSRPTNLAPGGKGNLVLTAINVGDAPAGGAAGPVTILDTVPAGLTALSATATAVNGGNSDGPVNCSLKARPLVACSFAGVLPPYDQIEVVVTVGVGEGTEGGVRDELAVSGGGAPAAQLARPLTISEELTPFGVEDYELSNEEPGGIPATQAGSHPFQQTTTIVLNQRNAPAEEAPAPPKDLSFRWPPGLVGNPTALPARCTLGQFLTVLPVSAGQNGGPPRAAGPDCPLGAVVGVATVDYHLPNYVLPRRVERVSDALYSVDPSFGEPARFGFQSPAGPVLIDPAVRSAAGADYGITVTAANLTEIPEFISSRVTVWGVPGDPRHDSVRGPDCLAAAHGEEFQSGQPFICRSLGQVHPPAFLTLPTVCSGGPLQTSVEADSWLQPAVVLTTLGAPMATLDGCNRPSFSPTISAEPTTDKASAPSGLDFNLNFHDEGLIDGEGLAQSQLNKAVVTLPEGFTINPSAGAGLGGCTLADYARETLTSLPGAGCPDDSKLGTVEIETPLLTQTIKGSLFIAQPHENPFNSLVALYIVARNPETGILIRLAGKVTPDPVTGQLVTTFENNPQLPFDHFNLHFREGQQAPLISPSVCGTYTTRARLTPWSEPSASLTDTSSFTITKGFDGGACPSGGVPPFHPGIQSGTVNNNAGAFSPFYLHLTRTDGEQEISGFSTNLPPGLTGSLTGIPFCGEAAIAAARTRTGREEEASPSCPASSQVGHTLVGTGVGAVLAYVPGKVYLAGPFHGAPFSLVAVTSAVVGPFDLGTVVLRFGLSIDPYTAQVSVSPTSSEPIPTIIDGIVTHVRDIRVYVERPGNAPFTLNPTSCAAMSIGSTLTANEGGSATVTSPFQAASCANLKFAPRFAVSTSGKTSKANGASLHVSLTYPTAPTGTYANIAKVKVELPKQLPSRLTTLQKACTATQFESNPAGCPSPSVIGTAKAVVPNIPEPLTGPVYFVSHGGEAFPSLEVVLQGYGVKVILVGATFISKAGITSTTFKAVPDNPVTSFELTLPQGPYSALAANGNLCTQKLVMPADFTGQNGATFNQNTPVGVTGCAKKKALTSAQKLVRALRLCHKKRGAKRTACEKAAQKRYGAPAKKKRKGKSRS